jgi:2-phospho-L-lactate guanylyltransferase
VNPRESATKIWAVVPVKPLQQAKSRLKPVLRVRARARLARSFLAHTLDVLQSVDGIADIVVVSRDPMVHTQARARGVMPLAETESRLNTAIAQACAYVAAQGASGALIVPTDLPLLAPADVEAIVAMALESECVVIAPDRRDEGTNALLLKSPQALQPAFGPGSFQAHQTQAAARGLPVHLYRSPTIALDIDLPDDLKHYRELKRLLDAARQVE